MAAAQSRCDLLRVILNMHRVTIIFHILGYISFCFGANILGIWYHGGKSHHILGEILLKELARRGHNVTMVSPFPLKESFPNYTDIHLTGILEDQKSREAQFMKMNEEGNLAGFSDIMDLIKAQTELTMNHTEMKKLVKSGTKFDVILMDWFGNIAHLVYGSIFNAPVIPLTSHGTSILASTFVGNPAPPSYVPTILLAFPYNMTFFQRLANTLTRVVFHVAGRGTRTTQMALVHKYYGESYTYDQIVNNIAIMFTNAHYSFEYPRPFVPNLIPIGGFHVQKPSKLPKELQQYMDDSKNGVIYFSLGSNMKSIYLPLEKQKIIMKVFSKLPCNILWKWEDINISGKSDNVRVDKWYPQNDILAHPNIKLFISHGGLLSTIESIYHGVPVLGIPIFGDQQANILTAVHNGYALHLELSNLTEETFGKTLNEILYNPRYKENAVRRSSLLRDQPIHPLDNAVFWVEHVIRHKGAPHLKNAGVYLSWYQYFLVDVVGFIVIVVAALIFIIYLLIKFIVSLICSRVRKLYGSEKKRK